MKWSGSSCSEGAVASVLMTTRALALPNSTSTERCGNPAEELTTSTQSWRDREALAVTSTRASRGLLKRAVLGLALLVTFVAGGAWLLYATIEPDGDLAGRYYRDEAANIGNNSGR